MKFLKLANLGDVDLWLSSNFSNAARLQLIQLALFSGLLGGIVCMVEGKSSKHNKA
jgi:hypothetical protein